MSASADEDGPGRAAADAQLREDGKGELGVTASNPSCQLPGARGSMAFTVTGGTGVYAGATGSGTIVESGSIETGGGQVTWTGTLTVPRLDFDLTPPVVSGARSKTVRAPRKAKRVRVQYAVTAADSVDGPVAVACKPPSGSLFRVGRTRVACTLRIRAATAGASFVVTVERR
jgi:hypothetical protein